MNVLLERDDEVGALESALRELVAGRGGLVVVEAAAGIGKTALLRHARDVARAAGLTVLSARGAELERDFTFGAVRQLFEPVLPSAGPARRSLFTGAAADAERLFGATDTQAADSLHHLLNGLYWLLVNLVTTTPTVLLVDDAQWVDVPSLRFLGFLARRVDSLPVTVVVASRSEERGEELLDDMLCCGDTVLLEPKALSEAAVAALVRRTLGPDADAGFCVACHAVTGGNPLFVRELLRILAAAGTRPDAVAVAAVEASGPDAVRRHLTARLRRHPAALRKVARAVAVLGDGADLSLVARQSDLTVAKAATAAEQLTRLGVFERDDPPTFVHAVVRDVVLSLIPLAERGGEHQRAAKVLADAALPATHVAAHLLRTTPESDPDRIGVLLAAASHARRQGSPGNAAVFLLRARNEPPPPALRSEVSRLLGNCLAHELAFADAETQLREALSWADSPAQWSLCAYSLARFRHVCGATGEAVALLTEAARRLPAGADMAAELEAELIGIARNDIASRPQVRDRLAAFRRLPGTPADVDAQLSLESLLSGAPVDDAVALARRALAGERLAPDRPGIWAAVQTLVVADCLDEADRRLNRALRTALRQGLLLATALLRGFLARVAFLRGDLALAREHVRQGMAGLAEPTVAVPVLQAVQVNLLVEDGRLAEADDILRGSALSDGHEPQTALELWLLEARIRLRAAQDRPRVALADALAGIRLYQQWGAARLLDVPWRRHATAACTRLGQRDRAEALVAEQLHLARSFGIPRHIGMALCDVAGLAEHGTVRPLLHEAVELLEQSAARLELAAALERLGTVLIDAGAGQDGRRVVGRAAELATECHATTMTARLHAMLAGDGGPRHRPRVSGVRAFTPAERQVAELAATGLTNRQIAEQLFLSQKTVEAHLSRAYRKLGVRSRTQLAVHLAAQLQPQHQGSV